MDIREQQKRDAEELAKDIERFVNGASQETVDAFVSQLRRSHRTLQQNQTRVFLQYIESFVEGDLSDKRFVDGRNEASRDIANKIVKGFRKEVKESSGWDCTGKPSEFLPRI
jgi:hypothetical protein